jgi:hypothetical protein
MVLLGAHNERASGDVYQFQAHSSKKQFAGTASGEVQTKVARHLRDTFPSLFCSSSPDDITESTSMFLAFWRHSELCARGREVFLHGRHYQESPFSALNPCNSNARDADCKTETTFTEEKTKDSQPS